MMARGPPFNIIQIEKELLKLLSQQVEQNERVRGENFKASFLRATLKCIQNFRLIFQQKRSFIKTKIF